MKLSDSIEKIKGIGVKKRNILNKMGIFCLEDALKKFPRNYEDRSVMTNISDLIVDEKQCVCAVVATEPTVTHIRKGLSVTKLRVYDETGVLNISFFNNKYIVSQLRQGETYMFYGLFQRSGKFFQMTSPSVEHVVGENPKGYIMPIYPLSNGITQSDMLKITREAILCEDAKEISECLPDYILQKYKFSHISRCFRQIHRPKTLEEVKQSRKRLIFEELFLLSCGLMRLKERRQDKKGIVFSDDNINRFLNLLKFKPTNAQMKTIYSVILDLKSGKPMNRLVQGDVGSGKTVIAQALCFLSAQNGYQSAVMAPTEILANQHYETFSAIMEEFGFSCVLLTGSLKAQAKREALEMIANGKADIIIGTHAIIQKTVEFANLGAVIIDEQHRFGVNQRAVLSAKGTQTHTLVMSATPIPRTLALIMYGDLDVSVLDELPPGRQPIETYAVGENMRKRIYKFIEKQCSLGGQVYVVCPLVEDSESGLECKSATEHINELQNELPHRKIGLLHGKMKPTEKDEVMSSFANKELDILVSTTVIEVGVNVPNATLMIVENADRFGLSQLHQLRGRIGRGSRQSYCIFFGMDKGEKAKERLSLLAKTIDGFEIAKADLAQRGPGDFFGSQQHGLPPLHIADLASNMKLLEDAQNEAKMLIERDRQLENYPELRKHIEKMFELSEENSVFN